MKKTDEKRNLMKRIVLMLCAVVIVVSTVLGSSATEVQAASKAKKAMAAYEKLLRNSDNWVGYTTFGLIDVNRDGIKELVVYDEGTNSTSLIGYCSGKMKTLAFCWGDFEIYSKNKIFVSNDNPASGMYSTIYYKYDGKKIKEIARCEEIDGQETYTVKGKNTSKKKYSKYIKDLHLGKGISTWKLKMHQNIKENRKEYLK